MLRCGVIGFDCLLVNEVGLKQYLRAAQVLTANGDDAAIWKLAGLLLVTALRRLR